MSFLDRFKNIQSEEIHRDWKILKELKQLDDIVEESYQKPVVLFKHSISCGISAMAKYQLEMDWDFDSDDLSFYYLDLINHREVSNEIADRLGVIHQSPQIILLKNGKPSFNTSHHAISIDGLKNAL